MTIISRWRVPEFVEDELASVLVLGVLEEELVDALAQQLGVVLALVALRPF